MATKKQNRKLYLIAGALVLLLLGIGLVLQIQKQQDNRSKAAGEAVMFTYTPQTQDVAPNSDFTIQVSLDAKTNTINGVDLKFLYDASVADLVSFQSAGQLNTELINTIDTTNGTLRFAAVNTGTNQLTGTLPIGTFTFRSKTTGTGNVQLQVAQVIASGISTYLPVDPTTPGSFTITSPVTPTAIPTTVPPTSTPIPTTGPSDTTPPTVDITSPADGARVKRKASVPINAAASDNVGVARVVFTIGSTSFTDTTAPYAYTWKAPAGGTGGTYTVTATAYDAAGNSTLDAIRITVTK